MADSWMIRGTEFSNCNCDRGCPCQFGSPTTHGNCEAITTGHIEEGHFNDTKLDGLDWALLLYWPGEIAQGNGKEQVIIDERADADQRKALETILQGGSTAPGATHFFVFNSTMSEVLETLYAPIQLSIDVDARTTSLKIDDIVEASGEPAISPFTGEAVTSRIDLPKGFEYDRAEVGNGTTKTKTRAGIDLDLNGSHGHFNILHMNQDGVIR